MHDSEVVAAIAAGDPDGLAEAYDRYAAPLYTYCRSLLREPADAADAVQDTFVIAASKVAGLRDQSRLRPWLWGLMLFMHLSLIGLLDTQTIEVAVSNAGLRGGVSPGPCDGTITQFRVTQITSAIVGVVYERDIEHVFASFKMKWKCFHLGIP